MGKIFIKGVFTLLFTLTVIALKSQLIQPSEQCTGRVKSIEILYEEFPSVDEESYTLSNFHKYYEFDLNDSLIKRVTYSFYEEDIIEQQVVYKRDKFGRMLSSVAEYFAYKEITENEYGSNGQLIKSTFITQNHGEIGKEKMTVNYVYDSAGRVIIAEYHENVATYLGKGLYEYDTLGNLIDTKIFDADDVIIFQYTYQYNEQKKIVNQQEFENDKLINKISYSYNENGLLISKVEFFTDVYGDVEITEEFDSLGRTTKYVQRRNGDLDSYYTAEYPSESHVIIKKYNKDNVYLYSSEKIYDSLSNIIYIGTHYVKRSEFFTIEYKYDEHNNWINLHAYDEKNTLRVEASRIIEYFHE